MIYNSQMAEANQEGCLGKWWYLAKYNYKIYFKTYAAIQILKHAHKKLGQEYLEITTVAILK